MSEQPQLSIVVIVYRMPRQAMNTLTSLLPAYQRDVSESEYEILVVENSSDSNLDHDLVLGMASNVKYLHRDEPTRSPAAACNHGIAEAAGDHITLMVDGARMVTPGLVRTALDSLRARPDSLFTVPGYHLGSQLQRDPAETGYGEREEGELLKRVNWLQDGYRLFDIAVLSGSCSNGYLLPVAETNFLTMSRTRWEAIGGVDTRFTSSGGGFVNLDLYRRAVEDSTGAVVVAPGEGTFHQFHGGVTTGQPGVDRESLLADLEKEYTRLRGVAFESPRVNPVLLGQVSSNAVRFLLFSARRAYEEACS